MIPFDTTQITSAGNYSAPKPGDPCHPLASRAHAPAIAVGQCQGSNVGGLGTLKGQNVTTGIPFIAHALKAEGHDASEDGTGRGVPIIAAPLRSMSDSPAAHQKLNGTDRATMVAEASTVRRLTPTECERLQGFPDGWTCLCGVEPYSTMTCRCSDSPRYRALGNAVTDTVAEWIGRRIMTHLEPPTR